MDIREKMKIPGWLKGLLIGFVIGAAYMSLVLDNRFGAMVKAFSNPDAINSTTFSKVVEANK